jgi:hypothetical protein
MEPRETDTKLLESGQSLAGSLRLFRSVATDAAAAIAGLWDPTLKTFWRSTEHRSSEESKIQGQAFFPTVTFRSLEPLLRLIEEHPEWADSTITDLALTQAVPALLSQHEEDMRSSLGVSNDGAVLNPFTLALYIDCLARVCGCARIEPALVKSAQEKLEKACEHMLAYSKVADQSVQVGAAVHPLVLFHVMRAIEAAMPRIPRGKTHEQLGQFRDSLAEVLKQQVKGLLAQDGLGVMNPGEGVAIAFCTAALGASREPEKDAFVQAALRVAFKFQDSSGCWPLGRIVRENQDSEIKRDLQIPTYEIAWSLAEAVLSIVEAGGDFLENSPSNDALARLVRSANYTASSAVQLDHGRRPTRGWCSEHAFGKPTIESWTSATVLESMLSVYSLAQAVDRRLVLKHFASVSPSDVGWPKWQRWASYKLEAEPEQDVKILAYLDRVIVESIGNNPRRLPRSSEKNVSLLLFGPPGTAKTTVVKALSDGLNWPLVFLSPGNFIERGLEYIEAQAKLVFDMLQRMSQAVVLFDECDELFRDRKPLPGTDQVRNITAFVTASMLPKLQDLHDRGRIVFAICTNHLESMDPAIKRGGRVDHIIGIGPPDRDARRKIIEQTLSKVLTTPHISEGIDELASRTDRFNRVEIERAASLLSGVYNSDLDARTTAKRIADDMKPSLTISTEEFDTFNRQKREFSHPHLERAIK